jgi:hypothetical protein
MPSNARSTRKKTSTFNLYGPLSWSTNKQVVGHKSVSPTLRGGAKLVVP